jgi:hypothetical protein
MSVLQSWSFFRAIVSFALGRCCARRGKIVNGISIVSDAAFPVSVYYQYRHKCLIFHALTLMSPNISCPVCASSSQGALKVFELASTDF